ncbi:hypothetical protein RI367_007223 [Sorochytrium milnesiophthora]
MSASSSSSFRKSMWVGGKTRSVKSEYMRRYAKPTSSLERYGDPVSRYAGGSTLRPEQCVQVIRDAGLAAQQIVERRREVIVIDGDDDSMRVSYVSFGASRLWQTLTRLCRYGADAATMLSNAMTDLAQRLAQIQQRAREVEKALAEAAKPQPLSHFLKRARCEEAEFERKLQRLRDSARRTPGNFPPMSDDMLAQVQHIFQASASTQVLADSFNIMIRLHDIGTLLPRQWLNDEVINFYGNMIMQRAAQNPDKYPDLHYFNSFFYSSLRDQGYQKVRRWTKKVDIFRKDYVIFPVHLGNHWCCGVINFKRKRIEYYDSLHGHNPAYFQIMREYLAEEMMDKKGQHMDLSDWVDYAPSDIPGQENGYDCGVFACTYADFAVREQPFSFSQNDMDYLRKRMVYEIVVRGQLLTSIE